MTLALIPQPKQLTHTPGSFHIPATGVIGISGHEHFPTAERARAIFKTHQISVTLPKAADSIIIRTLEGLKRGSYRLAITPRGVIREADSAAAAFHGLQTLEQIAAQSTAGTRPCLRIDDWPDYADRGVYYDVCRGRVQS